MAPDRRLALGGLVALGLAIAGTWMIVPGQAAPRKRPDADVQRDGAIVDQLFVAAYLRCWHIEKLSLSGIAMQNALSLRVERDEGGVLIGKPVVVNRRPGQSADLDAAAVRAVERCRVIAVPDGLALSGEARRSGSIRGPECALQTLALLSPTAAPPQPLP